MTPTVVYNPTEIDFDKPGKAHYQVAFHMDSSWGYSLVPMTVINGTGGGAAHRVSSIVAFGGTHGNEYEGQVAVKRLCTDLAPEEMAGRLILIPQLSESACRAHQRSSPQDGVNMNRAFPGNPRGSLSFRISHFIKTVIFPQVKVVLDFHAGGMEAVFPICASFHPLPNPRQYAETVEIARLFDTPFIFIYSRQMASGLLTDEAEDEGKIALGGEFGQAQSVGPRGVRHVFEGTKNVLRHYGMLCGEIARVDPDRANPPRMVQAPLLTDYIPTPRSGIWEPVIEPGAEVQEGELIGRIHDFDVHCSQPLEVRAHKKGVIIAMFLSAVCPKGLTLYVIGEDVRQ
jgi:predicted deacylase